MAFLAGSFMPRQGNFSGESGATAVPPTDAMAAQGEKELPPIADEQCRFVQLCCDAIKEAG